MSVNDETCEHLGLDPKKIASIARRLNKIGKEMDALGIFHFGGSGSGQLRHGGGELHHPYIIADIDHGNWDGGDGASHTDANGHQRGE